MGTFTAVVLTILIPVVLAVVVGFYLHKLYTKSLLKGNEGAMKNVSDPSVNPHRRKELDYLAIELQHTAARKGATDSIAFWNR